MARRGYHLSREYAVDPLEIQFVREVMRTSLVAFSGSSTLAQVRATLNAQHTPRGQHLYPVVDEGRSLLGVITRKQLAKLLEDHRTDETLGELARPDAVAAYPDEPLRVVVYRMAETGLTRMPVIERGERGAGRKLAGMISLEDLLAARTRNLTEERTRERVLRVRIPFGTARAPVTARASGADDGVPPVRRRT